MLKIGLFDSGIGGFSILLPLMESLPQAEFIYLADSRFVPYGSKSDRFVVERSVFLTKFLIEHGVDLVVVACNSATAVAIDHLRQVFQIPIVGVEPYLNVINHIELTQNLKVQTLVTPMTASSQRFLDLKNRVDPNNIIYVTALKNLATIVENYWWRDLSVDQLYLTMSDEFKNITDHYDFSILGCTHYPLVQNLIEKILNTKCLGPQKAVVKRVHDLLTNKIRENQSDAILEYFYFWDSLTQNLHKTPKLKLLNKFQILS